MNLGERNEFWRNRQISSKKFIYLDEKRKNEPKPTKLNQNRHLSNKIEI